MSTEVTIIIRDVHNRTGQTWAELLQQTVYDEDGEIVSVDEDDV